MLTITESPLNLIKNSQIQMLISLFLILLLTIVIYFSTWHSIAAIWIRSETFTHGMLVIPASIWLVWQNKAVHPQLYPTGPSYYALAFILLNGLVWLLSTMTQVLVIQQYALVGILVGSIWFYLGNRTTEKILFPLAFLYFMVPVGEALFPYLMEFTASFAIFMLRLTGLSVYREGMHFTLTSGQWSVVEACSGLRYLIASFTLGVIYAYITYQKTYKRVLFTLFSIVLPIIANGFRAYMIVMIGHLSDMKLAVGFDHIIYGAVFFGIIIFLMFYIGSFWKDPIPEVSMNFEATKYAQNYSVKQNSLIFLTLFVSLAFWPISAHLLQKNYQAQTILPAWPPLTQNLEWHEINAPVWGWQPRFDGVTTKSLRYFQKDKRILAFYQASFGDEKQGVELVNYQNKLIRVEDQAYWHIIKQKTGKLDDAINKVDVITIRNNFLNRDIMAIKWYALGNYTTNNSYIAKFYQLVKRLTLNSETETINILYFIVPDDPESFEFEKMKNALFNSPDKHK